MTKTKLIEFPDGFFEVMGDSWEEDIEVILKGMMTDKLFADMGPVEREGFWRVFFEDAARFYHWPEAKPINA